MKTTQSVEVIIGSQFDFIDLVQTILDDISLRAGFDEEALHWTGMAVREALNNAIKHGNRLDPEKNVRIQFLIKPDVVDIRITDQGDGFDVGSLPDPTNSANLLKPSGRGIFYIRSFMDLVEFNTVNGKGCEVHMVKRRPKED